jgi:DNA modification methylase
MTYQILQGDCLATLRTLPAESVHCVVTSPPYFGLRDYGTAAWEGGDPECDHVADAGATKKFGNAAFNESRPSRENTKTAGYYTDVCPRCGARRIDAQIGLEPTPAAYVAKMVEVFSEVWRVLRDDGVVFLNLGDSYAANRSYQVADSKHKDVGNNHKFVVPAGLKPKDLIGIPWRVAFALQDAGWYLRSDIIWHKPNPMPESVTDRPTKAHEYIFLLTKSERYFYDAEAIKEGFADNRNGNPGGYKWSYANKEDGTGVRGNGGHRSALQTGQGWNQDGGSSGRNRRSVWTVATQPYAAAHFATYPPALIEPCILAGTSAHGCCSECGAPWRRVVEKETSFQGGSGKAGRTAADVNANGKWAGKQYGENIKLGPVVTSTTTDWQPSCNCAAPVQPCTVLDPFAGSGTTLAVALKHGRAAIGCELNPEYIDLIHRRCAEMSVEPLRTMGEVKDWSGLGLFAEAYPCT